MSLWDVGRFDTHRTYRAYRGAEAAANTDHVLVAADLVFTIMKPKKTHEVRRPYMMSTDCPGRQNCSSTTVQNKFDALGTPRTTSPASGSDCSIIRESAEEVIGPRKNILSTLVIRGHLHIIQLKAAAKRQQNDAERNN